MNNIKDCDRLKMINDIALKTLLSNILLSIIKIILGFFAKSGAMIADGFHTVSDIISTLVVMIGVKFSSKEADEKHPYGHERIESLITLFLSLLLIFTSFFITFNAIKSIINNDLVVPKNIALIGAILSIIVKELMYQYTIKVAKKINSTALEADAWHHRSDALSSFGTLIGIGGAVIGFKIFDPIASIVVSFLIMRVAFDIFRQGFNQLVDKSVDDDIMFIIENSIKNIEGVIMIDDIKTRLHGSKIYVDVEIAVNSEISVGDGHIIAENVHNKIENILPNVKHCMVHVNPYICCEFV